jgi:predicted XRE-type DNA-binding protein
MTQRVTTGPSGQSYVEADDVFDLLFDDPAEAAEARARATLMEYLRAAVAGWTQAEAARRLGTTQPRVSALVRGKVEEFSLSALIKYVTRLGAQPIVSVRTAHPPGEVEADLPDPAGVQYVWSGQDAPPVDTGTWMADAPRGLASKAHVVAGPGATAANDYSFQLAA